jgi:hypothetical protein
VEFDYPKTDEPPAPPGLQHTSEDLPGEGLKVYRKRNRATGELESVFEVKPVMCSDCILAAAELLGYGDATLATAEADAQRERAEDGEAREAALRDQLAQAQQALAHEHALRAALEDPPGRGHDARPDAPRHRTPGAAPEGSREGDQVGGQRRRPHPSLMPPAVAPRTPANGLQTMNQSHAQLRRVLTEYLGRYEGDRTDGAWRRRPVCSASAPCALTVHANPAGA